MALVITKIANTSLDAKAMRFVTVVSDESTSTITAASLGLDQIEFCGTFNPYMSFVAVSNSELSQHQIWSVDGDGSTLRCLLPYVGKTKMMLIGW